MLKKEVGDSDGEMIRTLLAARRFDQNARRFDQNYRREFVAKCVVISKRFDEKQEGEG